MRIVEVQDQNPVEMLDERDVDIWRYCPHRLAVKIYLGCPYRCLHCPGRLKRRDYDKRILAVINAPIVLEHRLMSAKSHMQPANLGFFSDPYQLAEEEIELTRCVLEIFRKYEQPSFIITKSKLILRDLEIISDLASKKLIAVVVPSSTIDKNLRRFIEGRSPPFDEIIEFMHQLHEEKIPLVARIAPIYPFLTDDDNSLREMIQAFADAGASHITAGFLKVSKRFWRFLEEVFSRRFPDLIPKYRSLYFRRGVRSLSGLRLADSKYRYRKLSMLAQFCKQNKLTFGTCKEGFFALHTNICSGIRLRARYYPCLYDYWNLIVKRGAVSVDEAIHIARAYRVSGRYKWTLRRLWQEGTFFKEVNDITAKEHIEKGILYEVVSADGKD